MRPLLNCERCFEPRRLVAGSSGFEFLFLLTLLAGRSALALASGAAGRGLRGVFIRGQRGLARAAGFLFVARRTLPSTTRLQIVVGDCLFPDGREIGNGLRKDRLRRGSRCLDNADRKQIRRNDTDTGTDRSASAPACGTAGACAHSCRSCRCRQSDCLGRFRCRQLIAERSRRCCRSDLVIATAPAEIDDVGVVRVLQYSGEVPLAQALAIAAKELARGGAHVAGANGSVAVGANGAANEVERFLPTQAQSQQRLLAPR